MLPAGKPEPALSEYAPLHQLLPEAEAKLKEALERSLALPMYKKSRHIPRQASGLDALKQRPYLSTNDLIENSASAAAGKYAGRPVQLWGSTRIAADTLCWFPRGLQDVSNCLAFAGRIISVSGIKAADVILVLSQPGYGATNMLPYALAEALKNRSISARIIPANMGLEVHVKKWAEFLAADPPTVMIAGPEMALELADILRTETGRPAMPGLRFILLYGVSNTEQASAVKQAYSADVRLSFGLDGLDIFGLECEQHLGIHLWLDAGVYEIIPDAELAKEQAQAGYIPGADWLWQSEIGVQGELVVTNFNEVMPLIRYRTGRRVESLAGSVCPCGRAHPRVILQ